MHISEKYTSIFWTVKHIQHTCISEVLCFGSHSYLMGGEAYPAYVYIQRIEHHSHSPGVMELNVGQLAHRQLVAWSGRSYGCKSETRRLKGLGEIDVDCGVCGRAPSAAARSKSVPEKVHMDKLQNPNSHRSKSATPPSCLPNSS